MSLHFLKKASEKGDACFEMHFPVWRCKEVKAILNYFQWPQ